jgi:hypothetical protein
MFLYYLERGSHEHNRTCDAYAGATLEKSWNSFEIAPASIKVDDLGFVDEYSR